MATHSSTLARKISWMEEPGRLQSMGSQRVGHNWATSLSRFTFMHWRRKWQPTPVFLPGDPRDGGAWWAPIYGVAQSQTWLTWLSSSSIPSYAVLLAAVGNGTVSLFSLSDFSCCAISMQRISVYFVFCALLNSLISYSSFLVLSLGTSVNRNRSSAINERWTSSFPICILFRFLVWLLYLWLTKLYWIIGMRVGTMVLILILEERLKFWHHWG